MKQEIRPLTEQEIKELTANGCRCEDWSALLVAADFDSACVVNAEFSGQVIIGSFNKTVTLYGGIVKKTGIYNSFIYDCVLGDNVYISNTCWLANYNIGDNVVINNVECMAVDGISSFGNGVTAAVINESGGRKVTLFDFLTAQTAYLLAVFKHNSILINKIEELIKEYTAFVQTTRGVIGQNTRILNCKIIKNVKTGESALLEGVERLENGSVNSDDDEPAIVGSGVIAENFIFESGAHITDGAQLYNCFIGQGSVVGKQFYAENTVIFANCEAFLGEACSVFAGPFTVTHHKSSLLIAGMFSFFNAGSGANQSNHMYKLGIVHQGIMERGCKIGSNGYISWPARIGAFTLILGRVYNNPDTFYLPFSYLFGNDNANVLIPAIALGNVGLYRDYTKWPIRDKRKPGCEKDLVHFSPFSPFTMQNVIKGMEILTNLKNGTPVKEYPYNSCTISASALERGLKYYSFALDYYLGSVITRRLEAENWTTPKSLQGLFNVNTTGAGRWLDIAGLYAPEQVINVLIDDITTGKVDSLVLYQKRFREIFDQYDLYEWEWCADIIKSRLLNKAGVITIDDMTSLLTAYHSSLDHMLGAFLDDAKKEFTGNSSVGYGVYPDSVITEADFTAVRGDFDHNKIVNEIKEKFTTLKSKNQSLLHKLKNNS